MLSSILFGAAGILAQSSVASAIHIGPIGRPLVARAPVSNWNDLGCYSDPGTGARVLKGYATTTDQASTGYCQNLCLGKGYSYTGTEYGTSRSLSSILLLSFMLTILSFSNRQGMLVLQQVHRHRQVRRLQHDLCRRLLPDLRRPLRRERLPAPQHHLERPRMLL